MRTVLRTMSAGALLAAVGGVAGQWVTADDSRDVTPISSAFTETLHVTPLGTVASPDDRSSYTVGKVVAISASSLTAVSSDGTINTYRITPRTTAVTLAPANNIGAGSQFTINEIVAIVGTVNDGTVTATVIADQAMANGNGPPMDG
jgi:hypothetical protein